MICSDTRRAGKLRQVRKHLTLSIPWDEYIEREPQAVALEIASTAFGRPLLASGATLHLPKTQSVHAPSNRRVVTRRTQ